MDSRGWGPAWATQPVYEETETQADRQTCERTEKGKGSREEAEGGTGGRWQLSSSPMWKLRRLKVFTASSPTLTLTTDGQKQLQDSINSSLCVGSAD